MQTEPSLRLWSPNFVILCSQQLLMTIAFYSTMPMIALFLEEKVGLSGTVLGMVVASATVAAILARFISGYLLDSYGRRPVYWSAFSLFSGLYFLYGFSHTAASMAALRFGHGLAWGGGMTAATTMAVDIIPERRRGEGIGLFTLVMMVSMALGPALGASVIKSEGFETLFFSAGVLALVGLLGGLFLRLPETPRRSKKVTLSELMEKEALRLGLVVFCLTMPYGFFMNFGAMYTKNVVAGEPGIFYAVFAAATGLSRVLAGRSFDRHGPQRVLLAALLLLCIGLLAMSRSTNPAAFYCSTVVVGMADGMGLPVILAMVNYLVPEDRHGVANSTVMTFFELGICGGVLLTSSLYKFAGWPAALTALAGSTVLAAIVWYASALPHYLRRTAKTRPAA